MTGWSGSSMVRAGLGWAGEIESLSFEFRAPVLGWDQGEHRAPARLAPPLALPLPCSVE